MALRLKNQELSVARDIECLVDKKIVPIFLRVTELFEIQEEDNQLEQEIFIEVTGTHISTSNA